MGKVLVKLYLDEDVLAAVDELAAQEVRSRSGMLGVLVRLGLLEQGSGPADDVIADLEAVASPAMVSSGAHAGKPRKRDAAAGAEVPQSVRDREASGQPPSPQPPPFAPGAPAASVDTPAEGPPAGSTNAPGKPHRHRYVTEVPGSRQGRAGVIQADFACACGEVKRQAVR